MIRIMPGHDWNNHMKMILIMIYILIPYLIRHLESVYQKYFSFELITKLQGFHFISPPPQGDRLRIALPMRIIRANLLIMSQSQTCLFASGCVAVHLT